MQRTNETRGLYGTARFLFLLLHLSAIGNAVMCTKVNCVLSSGNVDFILRYSVDYVRITKKSDLDQDRTVVCKQELFVAETYTSFSHNTRIILSL
jgi:hypothetical protein